MERPISCGSQAKPAVPFQIEIKSLKQMRRICDPITAPFEDFHLVIEALHNAAALPAHKVVRDFIEPVSQSLQEGIKTTQFTVAHALNPTFNCSFAGFFRMLHIKNGRQPLSQIIGLFQFRRAFKQQCKAFLFLFVEILWISAKQPHRSFQSVVIFFFEALFQAPLHLDSQFIGAIPVRFRDVESVGNDLCLRQRLSSRIRIGFPHIGADFLYVARSFSGIESKKLSTVSCFRSGKTPSSFNWPYAWRLVTRATKSRCPFLRAISSMPRTPRFLISPQFTDVWTSLTIAPRTVSLVAPSFRVTSEIVLPMVCNNNH